MIHTFNVSGRHLHKISKRTTQEKEKSFWKRRKSNKKSHSFIIELYAFSRFVWFCIWLCVYDHISSEQNCLFVTPTKCICRFFVHHTKWHSARFSNAHFCICIYLQMKTHMRCENRVEKRRHVNFKGKYVAELKLHSSRYRFRVYYDHLKSFASFRLVSFSSVHVCISKTQDKWVVFNWYFV